MAKIEAWLSCDLKKPVQVQGLSGNVFSMDNNGSRINVRIYDNGEKTTVSGSVTANCILADGSTINVNGSLTTANGQSVAYVDIPQSCLLVPGPIRIAIKLTASGVITTLAAVVTTVYRTQTDIVITPSAQIIQDWNAEISAAIATQNAAIANQDTKINDLKSAVSEITGTTQIQFIEDYYIKTNISVGQTVDLTPQLNSSFSYAIIDCNEGDRITLNAKGWTTGRLWAFIDTNNTMLSNSDLSVTADNLVITAPSGAVKCIINSWKSYLGRCFVGISSSELESILTKRINTISGIIDDDVMVQSSSPFVGIWEQGGIAGTGELNTLTTRIRTKQILCKNATSITISVPSGYESWLIFLRKDGTLYSHGDWDNRANITVNVDNSDIWYFRYAVRRTDGQDIDVTEGNAITITLKPYADGYTDAQIALVNSRIDALDNTTVTVDINGGGDYTSILGALKANQENKKIIVKSGTYNVVNEYIEYYGSDFWTNYNGFGGSTDNFLRGLYVSDGVTLEFESNATVVFDYNGSNTSVAQYFSVIATGQNATVIGAHIVYGNGIAEYAIHDDHATEAGTNIFKNIIIDGVPSGRGGNHIGVGCGINNTYIFDGIIFTDASIPDNYGDIYFHNNISSDAENRIIVRNCYGLRGCTFRYYGQSTKQTYCIANGNKFRSISLRQHTTDGSSPNENMTLISFNNEVAS